ncbi:PBSX family phage terminase large subunit [Nicoliella lavandulae]|uniref:PBSX family phage terminase large subunit n=1 Tax=Nicoliella lavandulae TaxID=3082954 RepID=A0ABU8SNL0_9LACO
MVSTALFNPKQEEVLDQVLNNSNWKIMINYGAKRSGKTYIDNYTFLMEVRRAATIAKQQGVHTPQYILGGTSSKTIQSNILVELDNVFGLQFKFDKTNAFNIHFSGLPAVRIVQAYTKSISGLAGIRGMTAYGAYINEASLANEEVFHEIVDRCSAPGARIVCDTNPDIPTHWLKRDYIDNDSGLYISNHFTLDDNPTLDPKYAAAMKQQTGMFYERSVLGNWVTGEGMVYSSFDKTTMVIDHADFAQRVENQDLSYYMGIDWGYEHTNEIMLLADDEQGNTYLLKEVSEKHKPIEHHIDTVKRIQDDVRRVTGNPGLRLPIYADSARPDNVGAFQDAGLDCRFAYKQSILKRVELLSAKISAHKFYVVKEDVDLVIDAFYKYVWDEKSGEPLKQDGDDPMDCLGYGVATRWYNLHHDDSKDDEDTFDNLAELGF